MDYMNLRNADNEPTRQVPYCQFVLNENQQCTVIGADFDELGGLEETNDHPDVHSQHWGKLSEQSFIFQAQLTNSLVIENWNFDEYPDPEVIILTKKESQNG